MKKCTKCSVEKGKKGFGKNTGKICGLSSWCLDCSRQYDKERYQKNKENKKASVNEYYKKNKQKAIDRVMAYYLKNKNKIKIYKNAHNKRYRLTSKEKIKIRARDLLRNEFRSGRLKKRNSCEICHNGPTQAHHDDYTKPLQFIELCHKCHSRLHRQYREQGIKIRLSN